jgi:hypothetical protein
MDIKAWNFSNFKPKEIHFTKYYAPTFVAASRSKQRPFIMRHFSQTKEILEEKTQITEEKSLEEKVRVLCLYCRFYRKHYRIQYNIVSK